MRHGAAADAKAIIAQPSRFLRRILLPDKKAELASLANHAMTRACRGMVVIPQKLSHPTGCVSCSQRLREITVGGHTPGGNLCQELSELRFEIGDSAVELHHFRQLDGSDGSVLPKKKPRRLFAWVIS